MRQPAVLAAAVFLAASSYGFAGDRYGAGPEAAGFDFEVRAGIGGYPLLEVSNFGHIGASGFFGYYFDADPNYTETLAGIYLPGLGYGYMTGVISLELDFNIKRWFAFTLGIGTNAAFQDVFDPMTGGKMGRNKAAAITILPEARFNWLNRDIVRLYSAIGIGLGIDVASDIRYNETETGFYPVAQFTPVGISLGRRVYWFAECGLGLQYIGGMTGIGVRF